MKLDDQTDAPLPVLPPRAPDSHKGDYGRALLVGGSSGISGAIAMAGLATLRSGAGLVTLAVPRAIQEVVASFSPCYMTHALVDAEGQVTADAAQDAIEFGKNATAVALGPGLGRSMNATEFVSQLYREFQQPMVVDADALVALAERPESQGANGGPRVLTPHPGEFARLAGKPPEDATRVLGTDQSRIEGAATAARDNRWQRDGQPNVVIVLKGNRTVVTDGQRYSLNQTGNPGMATGGSGDVLTGVITALLCQGLSPFDAARLGVHVHGLAGDMAALELGQVSLIASDLIDYLPQAFQAVGG